MRRVKTAIVPLKRRESSLKIRKLHFLITTAASKARGWQKHENERGKEGRHFNGKYFASAKKDRAVLSHKQVFFSAAVGKQEWRESDTIRPTRTSLPRRPRSLVRPPSSSDSTPLASKQRSYCHQSQLQKEGKNNFREKGLTASSASASAGKDEVGSVRQKKRRELLLTVNKLAECPPLSLSLSVLCK